MLVGGCGGKKTFLLHGGCFKYLMSVAKRREVVASYQPGPSSYLDATQVPTKTRLPKSVCDRVLGELTTAPQRIKFGGTASGGDLEKESGLITVRYAAASVRLPPKPRALRASWELLLPSYSDQATLAAALLKMMENTPEGSHFDFSSLGEARRELS